MANKGNSESNKFGLTCNIFNIATVTIPAPSIGSKLLYFFCCCIFLILIYLILNHSYGKNYAGRGKAKKK